MADANPKLEMTIAIVGAEKFDERLQEIKREVERARVWAFIAGGYALGQTLIALWRVLS